jgi:hypothetical protein
MIERREIHDGSVWPAPVSTWPTPAIVGLDYARARPLQRTSEDIHNVIENRWTPKN